MKIRRNNFLAYLLMAILFGFGVAPVMALTMSNVLFELSNFPVGSQFVLTYVVGGMCMVILTLVLTRKDWMEDGKKYDN